MRFWKKLAAVCLAASMLLGLSGCLQPTSQFFSLPKRSDEHENLQKAIDAVMSDFDYRAPAMGENQQTLQMADLDGDGVEEALLFAKGSGENPLTIFVFDKREDEYVLAANLSSTGASYEQVEYAQMDGQGGVELIVSRVLSSEVPRALTVYTFGSDCQAKSLLSVSSARYMTLDLTGNGLQELFVLSQDEEIGKGSACLYSWGENGMERSTEVPMSTSADQIRRIILGNMSPNTPAVFVASVYQENSILTDVFAFLDGTLQNVSMTGELGISVETIRNYYVYADDIDGDGIIELPSLLPLRGAGGDTGEEKNLIRWFNLDRRGLEHDKLTTYHNYTEGWYVALKEQWVPDACVLMNETESGKSYVFGLWNEDGTMEKLFTIYVFTGEDREERAADMGLFEIARKGEMIFSASMGTGSQAELLTQQDVIDCFHFIQIAWKTGET